MTILDDPDFIYLCQSPEGREAFGCFVALIAAAKVQDNGGEFNSPLAVVAMMIRWPERSFIDAVDMLIGMNGKWLEPTSGGGVRIRNFAKWNSGWGGPRDGAGRPAKTKRKSRLKSSGNQDGIKTVTPASGSDSVSVSSSPLEKGTTDVVFPECLNTPRFAQAWGDWIRHRKEKKSPMTPTACRQAIKKMEGIGHDRAIAAISHSLSNGYTGIYEENERGSASNNAKRNGSAARRAEQRGREFAEPVQPLPIIQINNDG